MTNHRQLQPTRSLRDWRRRWSENLDGLGTATVKFLERKKRGEDLQPVPHPPVIRLSAITVELKNHVIPGRGLSPASDGRESCFWLLRPIASEGVRDAVQSGQPLMRLKAIFPWGSV